MQCTFNTGAITRLIMSIEAELITNGAPQQYKVQADMRCPAHRPHRETYARRGLIFFAATKVRILPARHVEQPRRHACSAFCPQCPAEILTAAARSPRRSSKANRLCCAISAKAAEIPPATPADFDHNGFLSSSPTTPATQSVSPMCRQAPNLCHGRYAGFLSL